MVRSRRSEGKLSGGSRCNFILVVLRVMEARGGRLEDDGRPTWST